MTTAAPTGDRPDRALLVGAGELIRRLRQAGCVWAEDEAALLLAEADTRVAAGGDGADARAAEAAVVLEAMVARRVAGEPLAHVLGWVDFAGLRVPVHSGVFVPRPRTEALAAEALRSVPSSGVLVELCCGAAPIAAWVLAHRREVEVHAADLDPAAVLNARATVAAFGGDPDLVVAGDLFQPLPARLAGSVDVAVANVPYVPRAEVDRLPSDARWEADLALDGGDDGLTVARRFLAQAARWLKPGGVALFEAAEHQVAPARAAIEAAGLVASHRFDGDADIVVVRARR